MKEWKEDYVKYNAGCVSQEFTYEILMLYVNEKEIYVVTTDQSSFAKWTHITYIIATW